MTKMITHPGWRIKTRTPIGSAACRGKHHYMGLFDDEVEAAKASDRKAWELLGEFAYLNFPEDYGR